MRLKKGIEELDEAVTEATKQRKDEHKEFVQTAAENNAALQLLDVAKNRLNKFYNPALSAFRFWPSISMVEIETFGSNLSLVTSSHLSNGRCAIILAVFSMAVIIVFCCLLP